MGDKDWIGVAEARSIAIRGTSAIFKQTPWTFFSAAPSWHWKSIAQRHRSRASQQITSLQLHFSSPEQISERTSTQLPERRFRSTVYPGVQVAPPVSSPGRTA